MIGRGTFVNSQANTSPSCLKNYRYNPFHPGALFALENQSPQSMKQDWYIRASIYFQAKYPNCRAPTKLLPKYYCLKCFPSDVPHSESVSSLLSMRYKSVLLIISYWDITHIHSHNEVMLLEWIRECDENLFDNQDWVKYTNWIVCSFTSPSRFCIVDYDQWVSDWMKN